MGIDLRLLPFDGPDFAHTVLSCDRVPELFDAIKELPSHPIDGRFATFVGDASGYGDTTEDSYGQPLRWLLTNELLRLNKLACQNPKNRAIWFYLAALPARTKVALCWH